MGPIPPKDEREKRIEIKKLKKKWKQEKLLKKLDKQQISEKEDAIEKNSAAGSGATKPVELSTFSVAVPGSILENAQSPELRTYLAGQIARAVCIYNVDEVIVFDDIGCTDSAKEETLEQDGVDISTRSCCVHLARILQYLECPQYLRKHIFPIHSDLSYAGILNPLDAPHHLRQNDNFAFREGVVANRPTKPGHGSIANVGLLKDVQVDRTLPPGLRVTVQLAPPRPDTRKLYGTVVSPLLPRASTGVYWGYSVRVAPSLSKVFSQAPYPEGYDLTIGTSDKGTSVDSLPKSGLPPYRHALAVFGGLDGLEAALEADDVLNVDQPALLFDWYLNTCPNQGSRTIRTEEAILISLATLQTKLVPQFPPTGSSKTVDS